MRINGRSFMGAFIFLLLSGISVVRAQEEESIDQSEGRASAAVYLRPADERLDRLDSALNLSPSRKAKVRRILAEVDAGVRRKIADGNQKIRALLSDEEKAAFDGLRDDTEGAPQSAQPSRRLAPMSPPDGGRGRGQGGGGQGMKGGAGGRGGRGGRGGQGGGSGGQPMQGGGQSQGGGGQLQGDGSHRCGDGVCDQVEKTTGRCPQDCSQDSSQ